MKPILFWVHYGLHLRWRSWWRTVKTIAWYIGCLTFPMSEKLHNYNHWIQVWFQIWIMILILGALWFRYSKTNRKWWSRTNPKYPFYHNVYRCCLLNPSFQISLSFSYSYSLSSSQWRIRYLRLIINSGHGVPRKGPAQIGTRAKFFEANCQVYKFDCFQNDKVPPLGHSGIRV